jgi:hypothetical protein
VADGGDARPAAQQANGTLIMQRRRAPSYWRTFTKPPAAVQRSLRTILGIGEPGR